MVANGNQAHVCAAKAGVDKLMKTLAIEWGPDGIRSRVNLFPAWGRLKIVRRDTPQLGAQSAPVGGGPDGIRSCLNLLPAWVRLKIVRPRAARQEAL